MKAAEIAVFRLRSQGIARPAPGTPEEVVARLGAVQAQDFPGAKWAIGLRLPDATDADVEQALRDRTILRTWPMRGTLHFVAARDAHWMLALLTPRIVAGTAARQKRLELDDAIFAKCRKLFVKALAGGRQLSREASHAMLEKAGISTAAYRGYHILWRLSQEGLLCFGAPEGKEQGFVLLDEWVAQPLKKEKEEALAELAARYFTGHGPATIPDFVWWSGLHVSEAKQGIALAGKRLEKVTVDGTAYWMSPEASSVPAPSAFLLPGFDQYLLGYRDRGAVLDPRHAEKICPGANGIFISTLVVDGRVVGTWKRVPKKSEITLVPALFAKLDAVARRGLDLAADRYGRFVGLPARLAF